ncbi:hypothetical protein [Flavobacterium beibuense]|uniref:hypothetical protein n=1 Tax=Flavobacterium beibuense TaxID=657326 RepID=UPI003A92EB14
MTKIQKAFTLEITPEQFLNSCSPGELMELEVLILSPRYQALMKYPDGPTLPIINPEITTTDEPDNENH